MKVSRNSELYAVCSMIHHTLKGIENTRRVLRERTGGLRWKERCHAYQRGGWERSSILHLIASERITRFPFFSTQLQASSYHQSIPRFVSWISIHDAYELTESWLSQESFASCYYPHLDGSVISWISSCCGSEVLMGKQGTRVFGAIIFNQRIWITEPSPGSLRPDETPKP